MLDLLSSNLGRLDEEVEADRQGVHDILSKRLESQFRANSLTMVDLLENLCSQESIREKIGDDTKILEWLLARIQQKEKPVGENKEYATTIIAILLNSPKNRRRLADLNGVDIILQLLSYYRKIDPEKDTEEDGYFENLFDCLIQLVEEEYGKHKFVEAEGIELCNIMLREGKRSKLRALAVIDYALGGSGGSEACQRFVQAAGLKTIFSIFMRKVLPDFFLPYNPGWEADADLQQDRTLIEHLLRIFASLLRSLPGGSDERIRTLAKFVEKDYEKIVKLVSLRRGYASKVLAVEDTIDKERSALREEDEDDQMVQSWLSRRVEAGLVELQVSVLTVCREVR